MKSAASTQTSANLKENGDAVPIIVPADRMPSRSSELAEGWRFADLRSVCEKTSIWNPAREKRDRFRYIDVSSVSNERFCIIDAQEIAGASAPSRARKIVKAGDVIYATVRPSLKRVAWIEPPYDDQIASTAFCIVRADPKQAVSKFLYYVLLSDDVNRKIIEHERGASYPAVTDKDVLNQFVLLPPIDEQEKIAAVLWKIQKAVEIEDAIVRIARDLKKSLLRRLFAHGLRGEPLKETEIGPLPESWDVQPLSQVREFLQYGTSQRCDLSGKGFPVLRIPNVVAGKIDTSEIKYAEMPAKAAENLRLTDGDLLFVRTNGQRDYVGRCAVYKSEPANALFASYLIRARLFTNRANPDFVQAYTMTDAGKSFLSGRSHGAADGKFNINTQTIDSMLVPVPSPDEQREIADVLQTVDRKIDIHESRKRSLQDLFKTSLNKLMTAQIRVNGLEVDMSHTASDTEARGK